MTRMLARPIEASELVLRAVREHALVHGSLIEHRVRPDDAALAVDQRVAAIMDVLHHEVVDRA